MKHYDFLVIGSGPAGQKAAIGRAVSELKDAGIVVSLFVDADKDQLEASKEVGADYVEIHTGHYSDAKTGRQEDAELEKIIKGIVLAASLGLRVNVGHGLNYRNTQRLVPIREIEEFSIGHSIIARAVLVGMGRAVREMVQIINGG